MTNLLDPWGKGLAFKDPEAEKPDASGIIVLAPVGLTPAAAMALADECRQFFMGAPVPLNVHMLAGDQVLTYAEATYAFFTGTLPFFHPDLLTLSPLPARPEAQKSLVRHDLKDILPPGLNAKVQRQAAALRRIMEGPRK